MVSSKLVIVEVAVVLLLVVFTVAALSQLRPPGETTTRGTLSQTTSSSTTSTVAQTMQPSMTQSSFQLVGSCECFGGPVNVNYMGWAPPKTLLKYFGESYHMDYPPNHPTGLNLLRELAGQENVAVVHVKVLDIGGALRFDRREVLIGFKLEVIDVLSDTGIGLRAGDNIVAYYFAYYLPSLENVDMIAPERLSSINPSDFASDYIPPDVGNEYIMLISRDRLSLLMGKDGDLRTESVELMVIHGNLLLMVVNGFIYSLDSVDYPLDITPVIRAPNQKCSYPLHLCGLPIQELEKILEGGQ